MCEYMLLVRSSCKAVSHTAQILRSLKRLAEVTQTGMQAEAALVKKSTGAVGRKKHRDWTLAKDGNHGLSVVR